MADGNRSNQQRVLALDGVDLEEESNENLQPHQSQPRVVDVKLEKKLEQHREKSAQKEAKILKKLADKHAKITAKEDKKEAKITDKHAKITAKEDKKEAKITAKEDKKAAKINAKIAKWEGKQSAHANKQNPPPHTAKTTRTSSLNEQLKHAQVVKRQQSQQQPRSRWVHDVGVKDKSAGKAWSTKKIAPSGTPGPENEGMFILRLHENRGEFILSVVFRQTVSEHHIVFTQDQKGGISTMINGKECRSQSKQPLSSINELVSQLASSQRPIEIQSNKEWPVQLTCGVDIDDNHVEVHKESMTSTQPKAIQPKANAPKATATTTPPTRAATTTAATTNPTSKLKLKESTNSANETETDAQIARDRVGSVAHGTIKQGAIGGFTETKLPITRDAQKLLASCSKGKVTSIVAIEIDTERNVLQSDFTKECRELNADNVRDLINPAEPRYYLIAGGSLSKSKAIFIYCCPDSSIRTERMVYATGKKHLLDVIAGIGIKASVKIELTDLDDLTDAELRGILPDAKAKPPDLKATLARKKTEYVNPSASGSLSAFMAAELGTQNRATMSVKIIKPPRGAYG